MQLSRANLENISSDAVSVPKGHLFSLPEKVLQFGTGVLLRGLPDYFIDKANRQGLFNGRIVVVKSTGGGDLASFSAQDGLYTLCMRGLVNEALVETNVICTAISRVLSAATEWEAILACAQNPDLGIVISNTTEVGIALVQESIRLSPPASFPGKLLAFLYERYRVFKADPVAGIVIIPTELISDNGTSLRAVVRELAHFNELEPAFMDWLDNANQFCNSLVDRIVPGRPATTVKESLERELGYGDELITMSEVYSLWAIEGDEGVRQKLSFAAADETVVITNDIQRFKELKLRLLNGTHTLSCGIAFLAGFTTVKAAMESPLLAGFIRELMTTEIASAIPYELPPGMAGQFAGQVIDRFSNPTIEHQWISITLNYTSKLKLRVVPVLLRYYELYNRVPLKMAAGFAAWLLFMKVLKMEGSVYVGAYNQQFYPVNDEMAVYFFELWKELSPAELTQKVLRNTDLWETDLGMLPGFITSVTQQLESMLEKGVLSVIGSQLDD